MIHPEFIGDCSDREWYEDKTKMEATCAHKNSDAGIKTGVLGNLVGLEMK